ncbi:hypothetical protein KSF_106940 [Reticulibacter mediterranei]|uniref:Uncharacterized protein n=1 Tax=Reticulibacter mediterranei TaxID=2778369 RepID=A0A8J3ITS4_9CHLR|nr:hypothetical protein KSF_106940 [Reticulibacter mediterranei]
MNETPVFGLILSDDGEVIVLHQFVPVCRFSFLHVFGASLFDNIGRNSQSHFAIDSPMPRFGVVLIISALGYDLVARQDESLLLARLQNRT